MTASTRYLGGPCKTLAQEEREVVRLPAIAEEDEVDRAEIVFGRQYFGRHAGDVL